MAAMAEPRFWAPSKKQSLPAPLLRVQSMMPGFTINHTVLDIWPQNQHYHHSRRLFRMKSVSRMMFVSLIALTSNAGARGVTILMSRDVKIN